MAIRISKKTAGLLNDAQRIRLGIKKPPKLPKVKPSLAALLAFFAAHKLPRPEVEFQFSSLRKWRFDFAWMDAKVALEVDGGIWTQGRHTRGAGWLKDTDKLNAACVLGWRLLRCTPEQLESGEIMPVVRQALGVPS